LIELIDTEKPFKVLGWVIPTGLLSELAGPTLPHTKVMATHALGYSRSHVFCHFVIQVAKCYTIDFDGGEFQNRSNYL